MTTPPPVAGAKLARELRNRLPEWLTQASGIECVDMVDPTGTWVLHIDGNATVDIEKRGEPAGVLRRPDPGALAAFLTVVITRRAGSRET